MTLTQEEKEEFEDYDEEEGVFDPDWYEVDLDALLGPKKDKEETPIAEYPNEEN